ncbi:ATP-binding protein, partial [Streptomyces sp. NPDC060075]
QAARAACAPDSAMETKKTETRSERLARYENASTLHSYLSRPFGHPDLGYLNVETRLIERGETLLDDLGQAVPVLLDQRAGNELTAFVDAEHDVFRRFGADYSDLLLTELAPVLKVRARSQWVPSQLVAGIRAQSLKESALDGTTVGAEARDLLNEIRGRTATELDRSGEYRTAYDHLSEEETTAVEQSMIASGRLGQVERLGRDAGFISYIPALALVRLVETMPEAFLDRRVFRGPYADVKSPSARSLSVARVTGYLADVATIGTFAGEATVLQLQRARLSITLLGDELAGGE